MGDSKRIALIAAELLEKLIKDELMVRSKKNLVQSQPLAQAFSCLRVGKTCGERTARSGDALVVEICLAMHGRSWTLGG